MAQKVNQDASAQAKPGKAKARQVKAPAKPTTPKVQTAQTAQIGETAPKAQKAQKAPNPQELKALEKLEKAQTAQKAQKPEKAKAPKALNAAQAPRPQASPDSPPTDAPAGTAATAATTIRLRGVRQNNLKGIDVDIPLGQLTVVTGLSGTGKSSLVFETLHAEGQRRYLETFGAYTRQFLDILAKPQAESLENLRPCIALEQSHAIQTSRSTVGTRTELCDYLRVWFAHHSTLIDPESGQALHDETPPRLWRRLLQQGASQPAQDAQDAQAAHSKPQAKSRTESQAEPRVESQAKPLEQASQAPQAFAQPWPSPAATVVVAFDVQWPASLQTRAVIDTLLHQGYSRCVWQGRIERLEQLQDLDPASLGTTLRVVQDRIDLQPAQEGRFLEAARKAFQRGQGTLHLLGLDGSLGGQLHGSYTQGLRSPVSGKTYRPATPLLFSFNSPLGACPVCKGFGREMGVDYNRVIPDPSLSLVQGAIKAFQGPVFSHALARLLRRSKRLGVRTQVPWRELSESEKACIIHGEPDYPYEKLDEAAFDDEQWYGIERFFEWAETKTYKMHMRLFLARYRAYNPCRACQGTRLQPESLCWQWKGHTLPGLYALCVDELLELLQTAPPSARDAVYAGALSRLRYLKAIGLGYLSLDRLTRTLSGGESQRVALTACLGASLVDTLFVLDEPSIGLHPQDIHQLIDALRGLTQAGNTVVVVEHDEAVIRAADHLIELGPEPGSGGGQVVFQGPLAQLLKTQTPTARGLRREYTQAWPAGQPTEGLQTGLASALASSAAARPGPRLQSLAALPGALTKALHPAAAQGPRQGSGAPKAFVRLFGCSQHNVKDLDLSLPVGCLTVLAGVSGSGKSTVLEHLLYENLKAYQTGRPLPYAQRLEYPEPKGHSGSRPAHLPAHLPAHWPFGNIVWVDQAPLSRNSRSNLALYTEAWEHVRQFLAKTPEAKRLSLGASHFSFNSKVGQCPHCQGSGISVVEMQFLADIETPCSYCQGKRFLPEVLAFSWQGYSVDALLALSVDEALRVLKPIPRACKPLALLQELGLGYLRLGQSISTLSGGEAQRLKLIGYLGGLEGPKALLLLDEPTTGLHYQDVQKLLSVLRQLVDYGHTVVVIEHHLDVLAKADWIIEMGPGAGQQGGQCVAKGPVGVLLKSATATGKHLAEHLSLRALEANRPSRLRATPAAAARPSGYIEVRQAREHNLKGISLQLPQRSLMVLTGVSGSGKSTLAFDILFAEGQRRFLECLSAYARQFVETLPRPQVESVSGLPATVAIAQRLTQGNHKSTVATLTEVAPAMRLLYAKAGQKPKGLDPETAARELDSQDFSWNTQQGWCPMCRGYGYWYAWMAEEPALAALKEALAALGALNLTHSCKRGKGRSARDTGPALKEPKEPTDPGLEASPQQEASLTCPSCHGGRLGALGQGVSLPGSQGLTLPQLLTLTPRAALQRLDQLRLGGTAQHVLEAIRPEVHRRLELMEALGLGYLSLDRSAQTLSCGESQRVRLCAQLGSHLCGVLYVLDEPSIGLHARDTQRLVAALQQLKARDNTVLVVEHDPYFLRIADHIVDLGPGAGQHGGELLGQGSLEAICHNETSPTAHYLRRPLVHPQRGSYRELPAWPTQAQGGAKPAKTAQAGKKPLAKLGATPGPSTQSAPDALLQGNTNSAHGQAAPAGWLVLEEPRLRHSQGGVLRLPLGRLSVVCGVSGAGKSTLVSDLLKPLVQTAIRQNQSLLRPQDMPAGLPHAFGRLLGGNAFRAVVDIDQSPIGKTPRSTPGTYLGVWDKVREVLAQDTLSKMHGYTPSHFSFNVAQGRCEHCKGLGRLTLDMHFLPSTEVACDYCQGKRYRSDLLQVTWSGKSLGDLLEMSFEEAAQFFGAHRRLAAACQLMVDTGLGYLQLGQTSSTLSGGEAQRLKLASELLTCVPHEPDSPRSRFSKASPHNLYILEEPTTGLHLQDCERLLQLMHRLVDQGHTVVVIEHHLDVIAEADYVVELGPESGAGGGQLLYQGPVEGLRRCSQSQTGPFLPPMDTA
jgi:excinuclease UvrABC ATPase subunit